MKVRLCHWTINESRKKLGKKFKNCLLESRQHNKNPWARAKPLLRKVSLAINTYITEAERYQ